MLLFLITPQFPRIEPSVCSRRFGSFSLRHRASANPQIVEPRGECFDYSQYNLERYGDILRGHIHISRLECNHVYYGEGRIIFTGVRVQRMLTDRSALLANVKGNGRNVSLHASSQTVFVNHPFFTTCRANLT